MSTISIQRRVAPGSQEELGRLTQLAEAFPSRSVRLKSLAQLALEVIDHEELRRAVAGSDRLRDLAEPALRRVITQPLPEGANQNITLPVSGVRYFGANPQQRQLALTLRDPENRLNTERGVYMDRVSEDYDWSPFSPHLVLGTVNTRNQWSEMQEWVEEHAPGSITLAAIKAKPVLMRHRPAVKPPRRSR